MASRISKNCVSYCLSLLLVCSTSIADPVATVKDVMLGLTIPNSDFIWGVEEEPVDDGGWDAIRLNAVMLAESANLLIAPGRARDGDVWASEARALIAAAGVTVSAVDAKDFDGVIDSGEAIYNTCETCHATYLLPSE